MFSIRMRITMHNHIPGSVLNHLNSSKLTKPPLRLPDYNVCQEPSGSTREAVKQDIGNLRILLGRGLPHVVPQKPPISIWSTLDDIDRFGRP